MAVITRTTVFDILAGSLSFTKKGEKPIKWRASRWPPNPRNHHSKDIVLIPTMGIFIWSCAWFDPDSFLPANPIKISRHIFAVFCLTPLLRGCLSGDSYRSHHCMKMKNTEKHIIRRLSFFSPANSSIAIQALQWNAHSHNQNYRRHTNQIAFPHTTRKYLSTSDLHCKEWYTPLKRKKWSPPRRKCTPITRPPSSRPTKAPPSSSNASTQSVPSRRTWSRRPIPAIPVLLWDVLPWLISFGLPLPPAVPTVITARKARIGGIGIDSFWVMDTLARCSMSCCTWVGMRIAAWINWSSLDRLEVLLLAILRTSAQRVSETFC